MYFEYKNKIQFVCVSCVQKHIKFNDVLNWKVRVVLQSLLQCNIHKWSTASHVFDFQYEHWIYNWLCKPYFKM